jgi:hypothetical protein
MVIRINFNIEDLNGANRNLKVKHWTIEVLIIEPTSMRDAYQYTALGKLINMKR